MVLMPNIDRDEIRKFEEQTASWWNKKGEFKGLHDINPLRANYIDQHSPVAGRRLVDVGCGGGILAEAMAARGAEVTGIDMAEASLEVARLHLLESGLEVDYQLALAEPFCAEHANQFDVITCMELLEHVPDPTAVLREALRVLGDDGELVCTEVDNASLRFDPPQPAISEWWTRFNQLQRQHGDPYVGSRLADTASALGATGVRV